MGWESGNPTLQCLLILLLGFLIRKYLYGKHGIGELNISFFFFYRDYLSSQSAARNKEHIALQFRSWSSHHPVWEYSKKWIPSIFFIKETEFRISHKLSVKLLHLSARQYCQHSIFDGLWEFSIILNSFNLNCTSKFHSHPVKMI